MRRVITLLVAALTTLAGTPAAYASTPLPSKLQWEQCADIPAAQCATVRVPLDYHRPTGRQIDLAISRIPSTDPGKRRGVLLTNPGGPGVAGRDFPAALVAAPRTGKLRPDRHRPARRRPQHG